MSDNLTAIFIITGVCVVLPTMIVWLATRARSQNVNRKYDLLHAAIEKGVAIDPNLLMDPKKERNSIKMQLLGKLQWGIILFIAGLILGVYGIINDNTTLVVWVGGIAVAVGASLTAIYFIGKRDLKSEIEAEEQKK